MSFFTTLLPAMYILRYYVELICIVQLVGVATISLETADLTPDSVDKILAHKSVKEKQAEYTSKLDTLRKKKRKEMGKLQEKLLRTPSKPKNPLGMIKKKFSTPNLESSLSASPPSATPEEVEMKPTFSLMTCHALSVVITNIDHK